MRYGPAAETLPCQIDESRIVCSHWCALTRRWLGPAGRFNGRRGHLPVVANGADPRLMHVPCAGANHDQPRPRPPWPKLRFARASLYHVRSRASLRKPVSSGDRFNRSGAMTDKADTCVRFAAGLGHTLSALATRRPYNLREPDSVLVKMRAGNLGVIGRIGGLSGIGHELRPRACIVAIARCSSTG